MTYEDEVLADAPVMYLTLHDTTGSTAVDLSGFGNDGTYQSSPTLGVPHLVPSDPLTSVRFLGPSQYITVPDATELHLTQSTCEAWVKLATDAAIVPFIVCEVFGGPHVSFALSGWSGTTTSMRPSYGFYEGAVTGWTGNVVRSPNDLEPDTTYYIVGTHDGTVSKIYVNAVEMNSLTTAVGQPSDNDGIYVNRRWDGTSTTDTMQHIAVYDYALSPERIAAHYEEGTSTTAPTESLFYWGG